MRITNHILNLKIKLLNTTTGHPEKMFEKTEAGWKYNVGCYGVEESYNFYNLVQSVNESGGQAVLTSGTKQDIVAYINAYLRGWSDARETK